MKRLASDARTMRGALRAAILAFALIAAFPATAFAAELAPPSGLYALPGEQEPVVAMLTWTPSPAAEAVGYRVYQSTAPDGAYRRVATTIEPAAEVFRGIAGVPYFFRVSAIDEDGLESSFVQAGPVTAQWTLSPHKTASVNTNLCSKCHGVHSAQDALLTSPELEVVETGPSAVCVQCHAGSLEGAADVFGGDGDSFGHKNGHAIGDPTHDGDGTVDCAGCHRIHGSAEAAQMLPAGALDATHAGNCVSCHDDEGSWVEGVYPEASEPSRDASGYPVAGTWPGADVYTSAYNAHARISETTQTTAAGTAVRRNEGDCLYCHAGHGSESTYDALRAQYGYTPGATELQRQSGDYARLCLDCHGAVQPARFSEAADIFSFVTSDAPTAGHRIVSEGASLPAGSALPCYECHNAHGSSRGNDSNIADALGTGLSTATASDVRALCLSCHTTADTEAGWDSEAGEYRAVSGSERVVGLARTSGLLGLPATVSAHQEDSLRSCYECHGNDYAAGGSNVHRPRVPQYESAAHTADSSMAATLTVGAAESRLACSECHSLELGVEHSKSSSTSALDSCMSCHPAPRDSVGAWDRQGCSAGECHETGTGAEVHASIETAHESPGAQACSETGCHSANLAVTHASASTTALGVERTSCLVCHDALEPPASNECLSCHPGYSAYQHAYSVPSHTAEQTGTVEITTAAGTESFEDLDCASCHGSSELGVVHNTVCASCHPVVVPETVVEWDGSCAQAGCHSVTDATPQHESIDDAHAAQAPAEKDCFTSGCHTYGSLAALHSQASTEVAGIAYESCQVCHRASMEAVSPEVDSCLSCHPEATEDHAP